MTTSQARSDRRRRPPRSEVRRSLLDAAARLFARRGIEATSIDDVAADAGFTKGAVYSNFGSKQDLIDALVQDRTSAYLDLGLQAVAGEPGAARPLAEQARFLGDRLTAATQEQRDWHLLFFELWQRAVRTGSSDDALGQQRRALREGVAQAVAEHADEAGATLPLPATDLAVVLMALTNGLAMERMIAPDDVPPELMGEVLALLVAGGTRP